MPKKRILLLLVCLLSLKVAAFAGVSINNLRCEMLNNPVGIDTESPRVSWRISSSDRGVTQLSYQILVASSMKIDPKQLKEVPIVNGQWPDLKK